MEVRSLRSRLGQLAVAPVLRALGYFVIIQIILVFIIKPVWAWLPTHVSLFAGNQGHFISAPLLISADLAGVVMVCIAASLMMLTERRQPGDNVLSLSALSIRTNLAGGQERLRQLSLGILAAAAWLVLIVGTLLATGHMHLSFVTMPLASIVRGQLVLLATFALAGFFEEFLYRGYIQRSLTEGIGFWGATILTSFWFGWIHYAEGAPVMEAVTAFAVAIFWCLTLRVTGGIAFAIGFHASWDFMEGAVFGSSDSTFEFAGQLAASTPAGPAWLTGGTVGPEASVLFLVPLAVLIFIMACIKPQGQRGTAPIAAF